VAYIRTTHTGSLPRPSNLRELLIAREGGSEAPKLDEVTKEAVDAVVQQQGEIGIDVLSDGEMGKISYGTYVKNRLSGFDGELGSEVRSRELDDYPDFADLVARTRSQLPADPACNGPVELKDSDAVHQDIENLKSAAALAGIPESRLFMTAASPGVIALFFEDRYYRSREDYLAAIVDAMRHEYRAIVDSGITLQLDCPDFAGGYVLQDVSVEEFRRQVILAVEAMNAALEGLPPERMRLHVCWGNSDGPHTTDIALHDIIDLVLRARPAGISLEASNPRHGHEWQLFESFDVPEDKYLIPGVIDSTTNFVEHPELVAQRIRNYVQLLGPDRVVAGSDCGFGTMVMLQDQVAPSVVWAKLRSMVEGARIAGESI
jgi:5-methyltetrahydropteroyltriglutamate--homocysteine methyltransferase